MNLWKYSEVLWTYQKWIPTAPWSSPCGNYSDWRTGDHVSQGAFPWNWCKFILIWREIFRGLDQRWMSTFSSISWNPPSFVKKYPLFWRIFDIFIDYCRTGYGDWVRICNCRTSLQERKIDRTSFPYGNSRRGGQTFICGPQFPVSFPSFKIIWQNFK